MQLLMLQVDQIFHYMMQILPLKQLLKEVGDDINTYLGIAINENLDDEIIVTVIATGFEEEKRRSYCTTFCRKTIR